MRLITVFELATRSEAELRVLFRKVSEDLVRAESAPAEKADAKVSLDNIVRVMRNRKDFTP